MEKAEVRSILICAIEEADPSRDFPAGRRY